MRVSGQNKVSIENAARNRGYSITRYMIDAALKQAKADAKRSPRGVHTGVPTFFRALCFEATQGGSNGYFRAGHELARHLEAQIPYDADLAEWVEEVHIVKRMATHGDDEIAWEWFEAHMPKMIALVPKRRMMSFMNGFRQYVENYG